MYVDEITVRRRRRPHSAEICRLAFPIHFTLFPLPPPPPLYSLSLFRSLLISQCTHAISGRRLLARLGAFVARGVSIRMLELI